MSSIGKTLSELYFHEMNVRYGMFSRLHFHYAIYASAIAMFAYMTRMVDYASPCVYLTLFYVCLTASLILLIVSAYFTWNALTGYIYLKLPKSKELFDYDQHLRKDTEAIISYNKTYEQNVPTPNHEERFESYIAEVTSRCIDHNSAINEARMILTRKALWYILVAALPFVASAGLFVALDMDASSPRKVSASFIESSPLVDAINEFNSLASITSQLAILQRRIEMSENNEKSSASQQQNLPPPPQRAEPKKPEPQYSTEDFKTPVPDKAKLLNEGK